MATASIRWKDVGNDMMKGQQYEAAVDCYNRAIEMDKDNILFFNNRSQAFIKTHQYVNAEKDATVVIQQYLDGIKTSANAEIDLEGQYKKALFRRSLARRGMGSLTQCVDDLQVLVSLEPGNKAAESELSKTKQLLSEQSQSSIKPKPSSESFSSPDSISKKPEVNNAKLNALDLKPVSTKRKIVPAVAPSEAPLPSVTQPIPEQSIDPIPVSVPSETLSTSKPARVKPSVVPTEPPKSEYEFERVWRSLRTQPALFLQYLSTFKPNTFKKVFKSGSISSDLLSSLFQTMLQFVQVHSSLVASLLESLTSVTNFNMILMLIPGDDIICVQRIIEKLIAGNMDCNRLKSLYKL